MRVARACFIIAAVSAVFAAGLVAADTYDDQWCFATPVSPCMGQCGCPIAGNDNDLCQGNVPVMGQTFIFYYYCTPGMPQTCTTPGTSNSCGGKVWNCECWTCSSGECDCDGDSACVQTDKPDACGQYYGCTSS